MSNFLLPHETVRALRADEDIDPLVAAPIEPTRRLRILVLASRDPYPVIGGDRLRVHRIARELAKYHDLTLLTLCRSERERKAPLPNDGVFSRVHRVVLPTWRSWLNTLAAVPSAEPLQMAYYRSPALRAAVAALAPEHDLVLAHLVRTADYVRDLPMPRVLDMTDAISMNLKRLHAAERGYFDLRRHIYALEARRLVAHERRIARDFDLVTLTSPVDRSFLFDRNRPEYSHVAVVANGVDLPEPTPPAQATRQPGEIVFVGNLHSLQNFDAAWFFARRVLPRVRASRPDAVLRIIGPVRPAARRSLAGFPGVRVEGIVPRLDAALASARVGVCPMRVGAGIQNKVLDYFAHRLAVVCSAVALEGLDACVDEHLLLAEGADDWARKVLQLLEDTSLAQRLADAGRNLATLSYRWDQRVYPLLRGIEGLLGLPSREVPDISLVGDLMPPPLESRAS